MYLVSFVMIEMWLVACLCVGDKQKKCHPIGCFLVTPAGIELVFHV